MVGSEHWLAHQLMAHQQGAVQAPHAKARSCSSGKLGHLGLDRPRCFRYCCGWCMVWLAGQGTLARGQEDAHIPTIFTECLGSTVSSTSSEPLSVSVLLCYGRCLTWRMPSHTDMRFPSHGAHGDDAARIVHRPWCAAPHRTSRCDAVRRGAAHDAPHHGRRAAVHHGR